MTQGNIPNQRKSRSRSRSRSRCKTKSRSRSTPRTASDGGHGLWADKARVSASVTGESQGKQNGKKLTWSETEADSIMTNFVGTVQAPKIFRRCAYLLVERTDLEAANP
ncbi:hypothetical protein HPB50_014523 [Hyalomma asiaticum]|uniref:Uncharacterized protein n=1 Tax=Hyalomma asiaticum TaxID=266040 RepID=A0ACB7SW87_HYAAI|nr:hypothetical protein HPB50_014523 [Hyalomma asiaticum]